MEDTIQFIAKHGSWVAVKKTRPHENSPLENALFLASVMATVSDRIEHYLHEAFDLQELDRAIDEIVKGKRASSSGIADVLAAVNGPKISKIINAIVEGLDLQKKEKEAVKSLLKAYALRRAFKSLKMKVDYGVAGEELRKGLGKFKKKGK